MSSKPTGPTDELIIYVIQCLSFRCTVTRPGVNQHIAADVDSTVAITSSAKISPGDDVTWSAAAIGNNGKIRESLSVLSVAQPVSYWQLTSN